MYPHRAVDKDREADRWLEAARSAVEKAKAGVGKKGVLWEDLCFDLYVAAERALTAYLTLLRQPLPPVKGIEVMMTHMAMRGLSLPDWMKELGRLDRYAVVPQWPWFHRPIGRTEYFEALDLAERLIDWVAEELENRREEGDLFRQEVKGDRATGR